MNPDEYGKYCDECSKQIAMDNSVRNFKKGIVSEPINLEEFNEEWNQEAYPQI